MVTPKFTFSGVASGLDTDSMVTAIMNAERVPQDRLKVKKAEYDVKEAAWSDIGTKVAAIRTALDGLKNRSAFDGFVTAKSSLESAVRVTSTTGAIPQATSFTVDRLATAHQVASGSFAAGSSLVGAGTYSITVGGTAHDFSTGASTTLDQLAAQINADSTVGVSASVVKVADGDTRLVLTSRTTGAAGAFTTSATQANGLAAPTVNQQGVDALLTMGALQITRSSNTVTDLIKGVTLDLEQTTTGPVTITTGRDNAKAVSAVKGLVDAVNATITQLQELTKYDPESKTAGRLQGDASARTLGGKLTSALSSLVAGLAGDRTSLSSVGVQVQRNGTFKLDEAKLTKALQDDYDGVASLFARSGAATDGRLSFVTSGASTSVGAHAVVITQAATAPGVTGGAYSVPGADETFSVSVGTKTVDITLAAGDSLAAAITKINSSLAGAGIYDIVASDDGGALRLASSAYGSGSAFTVAGASAFGLDGSYVGTDVAGTIDGLAATGSGQTLSGTTGGAEGLIVRVTASPAEVAAAGGSLALGSLTYTEGVTGQLLRFLDTVTADGGTIALAKTRYENQEKVVDQRIAAFDSRLALKETTLRRQFTAMETALSNLQSQQSYLASALGSLPSY